MKRHLTLVILLLSTFALSAQVTRTNTSIYYTMEEMLLANEINESGEPFAEALGYNLDDLDPMNAYSPDSISYTLGINNYEYSRYQLGTIVSRSGMGLHLIWAPVIGDMAAMETDPNFDGSMTGSPNGYKEDDELMKNIMHFSMLANHPAPKNPWPQFAEFMDGDPHYAQDVDAANFTTDFSTLRWDRSKMNKILNPGTMGQTLMKQYLWAQDMLGGFHDADDNGIDPDGIITPDSAGSVHFDPSNNVFYGGDGLDGFIGHVLTAEGINKVKFILTRLAYNGSDLGMVDPMTYDPSNGFLYFPHKVTVSESVVDATMPPKYDNLSVMDSDSYLWDQLSLLWGTLSFKNMMDPDNNSSPAHFAYHSEFDGDPFPAPMSVTGMPGPYDLMKGASKVLLLNILNMHFDGSAGTFVDVSSLNGGVPQLGSRITTLTAGYITAILKIAKEEFAGTPLESMISEKLSAQADFIINNLKNSDGTYSNYYDIGAGADGSPSTVESQAGAVRGLYAAYESTGNTAYRDAADDAYTVLVNNFYIDQAKAFRTTDNDNHAVYTPLKVAVIAGATREASLVGGFADAPEIYTRFFTNVGNSMQLAEGANTGETGGDSDGDGIPFIPEQSEKLAPVFAAEATLDIVTAVENENSIVNNYELKQNYPNPFNPSTVIEYSVPENSMVSLKVYNILGQQVGVLVNEFQNAGKYQVDFSGEGLTSGVYFYRLNVNGFTDTKRMALLK